MSDSPAVVTPANVEQHQAIRVLTLSTIAFSLLFAVWLIFGVLSVAINAELKLGTLAFVG